MWELLGSNLVWCWFRVLKTRVRAQVLYTQAFPSRRPCAGAQVGESTDPHQLVGWAAAALSVVLPSPATHAIFTVLKAGGSVFRTLF